MFNVQSQVTWDTVASNNISVCLKPEVLRIAVTISSASSGSYFEVGLPAGISYKGIAYQNTPSGKTISYAGTFAGRYRFSISGTPIAGEIFRLWILQSASCASTGSSTFKDTAFFYNGSSRVSQLSNAYNTVQPSLSITSISTVTSPATVGATVTRRFTITNGGFGPTAHIRIQDKWLNGAMVSIAGSYKINPTGVNYTIPAANITSTANDLTLVLTPTDLQQTGDGDSMLENGESFVLEFKAQVTSCGNSSNQILSTLSAYWLCNGSSNCSGTSVSAGLSVTVPTSPNFNYLAKFDNVYCANGTTAAIDTVRVINTGGAASNFILSILNTSGGAYTNGTSRIDTSNIYYKIGKNGVLKKIKTLSGTTFTQCGGAVGFSRVNLDTLKFVNAGDTVFFMAGRIHRVCDNGCSQNSRTLYATLSTGIGIAGSYSNACKNLVFSIPSQELVARRDHGANISYNGISSIACGQKGQLQYTNSSWWFVTATRVHHDFVVTLPSFLLLDTVSGVTAYFKIGSTLYYPSARPTANTFRFKLTSMNNGVLFINVKGTTSTSICSTTGVLSLNARINPDTTAPCNSSFPFYCVQNDLQWYSCTSCCSQGLELKALTSYRKNIDIKDPLNNGVAGTGLPDTTLIQRRAYIIGDTMLMYAKAIARTSVANPKFEFAYFKTGLRGGSANWAHIKTTVVQKGPLSSTTTLTSLTPTFSGDSVVFDLSSLPDLLNGDTITLQTYFRVKYLNFTNTSLTATNETRFYASRVASPTIAQQIGIGCGRGITTATLHGFLLGTGGSTIRTITGCTQIVETGGIRYTTENEPWPFEIRPFAYPSSIAYKIPSGYVVDSVNYPSGRNGTPNYWSVSYSTVGDSIFFNPASLFKPNGGPERAYGDREEFQFRVYLTPTCKATTTAVSGFARYYYVNTRDVAANRIFYVNRYTLQANMPQFVLNSTAPVARAYEKKISWPVNISNVTSVNSLNTFLYLRSSNGLVAIDSVYNGSTRLTAASGFYKLGTLAGNGTLNLTIYATSNTCNYDSIEAHIGFDCKGYPTAYTSNICGTPKQLYVQPQTAEIQTQITPLSATPSNPANASSTPFGTSTIASICDSVPVEMLIVSSQAGSLYNVHEILNIPLNSGQPGLSFVSGSGYIEYPLGTTPRAFSAAANAALTASGLTQLDFSLDQIDPSNFNTSKALAGTGTAASNNSRQVKLRFKLKSNCNFSNGDQWNNVQKANLPCGNTARLNNLLLSGYSVAVTGVSNPYNMNTVLRINKDSIVGLRDSIKVSSTIQKIGATAVGPTDTLYISLPSNSKPGTIYCYGASCPSATPAFVQSTNGSNTVYKLKVPLLMGNADTLRFETWIKSNPASSGCSDNNILNIRTTLQTSLYCSTTASNCPGSQIVLGQAAAGYNIKKPNLAITGFNAAYPNSGAKYTYQYEVFFINNGTSNLPAGSGYKLQFYFDADNNSILDINTDRLIYTATLNNAVAMGGSSVLAGSFTDTYLPSASRSLWAVWSSAVSPNANCSPMIASSPVMGLPISLLSYRATSAGCVNNIEWRTTENSDVSYYSIQFSTNNNWKEIGKITPTGSSALNTYSFTHYSGNGEHYYRVVEHRQNGQTQTYPVLFVNNLCISASGNLILKPNPASNQVSYDLRNTGHSASINLSLVNAEGKVVLSQKLTENSGTLDISRLSPGVYMVNVKSDSFYESTRLIVQ